MESKYTLRVAINDNSDISAARRLVLSLADRLHFREADSNRLAIIVSELASNLFKHATKAPELLLQPCVLPIQCGIEILALDKGPGIANVSQCLQDGYSTTHTSGTGLGALARLADNFTIYSLPDIGTAIRAEIHSPAQKNHTLPWLEIGAVCRPKPGEEECGDSWSSYYTDDFSLILVADGLGHGPEAAEASQLAVQIFQENINFDPVDIVKSIDKALHKTRGAAVAVAKIEKAQSLIKFAGLGNISSCILMGNKTEHLMSHNGTSGIGNFRIQEFTYAWHPDALLLMHSDGLTSRWKLESYPGLAARPSALIASVLYRDFFRGYDDGTIVVAKQRAH